MDIRPPKKPSESFTIVRAKALIVFSRIVGVTAIASQIGVLSLVPEKYQKPVSAGALLIGIVAIWTGNEKQGSAIVQARMAKRDIFTAPDKPGASKENALYQVFLTAGELALAKSAVTQQAQPMATLAAKVPTVDVHRKMADLVISQPVDPADFDRVNIPPTVIKAATVINGLPASTGDASPIPSLLDLSKEVEAL